jgi:hypothetical protein
MPRFRPQLRFSLRTLFILVTLLAWVQPVTAQQKQVITLGTGWVVDITDSDGVPAPGLLGMFGEQGHPILLVMGTRPRGGEWTPADEVELKRAKELFPEASVDRLRRIGSSPKPDRPAG